MSRGGKRQGAGRKASSGVARVTLNARVLPSTLEALRSTAAERGISVGALIDALMSESQA